MTQALAKIDPLEALTRIDRERAVRVLHDLASRQTLTPAAVVDAGRPAASPLHGCFEWDETRAAEGYREEQARRVIRCVRVVHAGDGDKPIMSVRAFISTTGQDDHAPSYRASVPPVLSAIELARQQLAEELDVLASRYAEHLDLFDVLQEARQRALAVGRHQHDPLKTVTVVPGTPVVVPMTNLHELRTAFLDGPFAKGERHTVAMLMATARQTRTTYTLEDIRDVLGDLVRESIIGVSWLGTDLTYGRRHVQALQAK